MLLPLSEEGEMTDEGGGGLRDLSRSPMAKPNGSRFEGDRILVLIPGFQRQQTNKQTNKRAPVRSPPWTPPQDFEIPVRIWFSDSGLMLIPIAIATLIFELGFFFLLSGDILPSREWE